MDQRLQFVAEWMKGERTMVELCRAFGVSRKTGYKWLDRYDENGPRALLDRPRRPCTSPWATDLETVELLVQLKKQRPTWGPRKLRAWLLRSRSSDHVPAASTIGAILKKRGLVQKRRRRGGIVPAEPFGDAKEPNDLWCTDFKGWFYVGRYKCHPLTIADAVARALLRAEGLHQPRAKEVQQVFRSAFWEFGLPRAIRSDNGPPFASRGPGGLTTLSAWWIKLGIRVERIRPGNPQENGRLERLHRTLKIETATVPKGDFVEQQQAFDFFRRDYNDDRPHEALGNLCPSDVYKKSSRSYVIEMDQAEMQSRTASKRDAPPNPVRSTSRAEEFSWARLLRASSSASATSARTAGAYSLEYCH